MIKPSKLVRENIHTTIQGVQVKRLNEVQKSVLKKGMEKFFIFKRNLKSTKYRSALFLALLSVLFPLTFI